MSTLVTRAGKGSPLTHNEVDANFTNLNTDKVEKTSAAITGGTIDNTVIGGTTPAAGTFTTLTATGQTSLGGDASNPSFRANAVSGVTRWIEASGSVSGTPQFSASSTGSATGMNFVTRGASGFNFSTNTSASTVQLAVSHTASAVNYVQVTGAATGSGPIISAQGSDADVRLNLTSKGTNSIDILTNSASQRQFRFFHTASAINYLQAQGSITGNGLQFSAQGSDTNISQVFQSKGTGAIDLAAGSSGVNISNGGTVTAITRTANGSYTSMPTAVISAPTTAGGTQATLSPLMAGSTATVVAGGTGYTVGDTLTIVGATGTPSQLTVATLSGSAVATVTFATSGSMSVLPTNPVSVTGGTGSGATFTMTYSIAATQSSFTAGSGYVEQPTVSFSGGGGSGAAAFATVGSGTTIKSLGSTMSFLTANGEQVRIAQANPPVNYLQMQGNSASSSPILSVQGTDTNIGLAVSSKGSSGVRFFTNNLSNLQLDVTHTASSVNYVQVTGAATGGSPIISSQGSDANTPLILRSKGAFACEFQASTGAVSLQALPTASSVNYYRVSPATTGFGPVLSAQGSDTNIPVVVQPKGTGALQAQQTDSTATGGNARGANAVDWQTIRDAATKVASGTYSVLAGGQNNTVGSSYSVISGGAGNVSNGFGAVVSGGISNTSSGSYSFVGAGQNNTASTFPSAVVAGSYNTAAGFWNFIGGGFTNSATSASAVTTQSATMNGTTAVTLAASNANIKVGQFISGTSIAGDTYVSAISGTSLTLSKVASGSSTSTLSFFTPHGVVVGGGNNQATGSYSFIGGGGDAGTAANRNVASGDYSTVVGGRSNTASGNGSFVGGGGYYAIQNTYPNTASGTSSVVVGGLTNNATSETSFIGAGQFNTASGAQTAIMGGTFGTTRSIVGNHVFPACQYPITPSAGVSQSALLILARQTTDATATVLRSDTNAASTNNQIILPNNSAYYFKGSVIANVTGGGNTKGWTVEGVIKRGANAASTTIVGTATVTSSYADAGASTWALTATADTTNGGLAITFTGQASTTIRVVAKLETTEVTF